MMDDNAPSDLVIEVTAISEALSLGLVDFLAVVERVKAGGIAQYRAAYCDGYPSWQSVDEMNRTIDSLRQIAAGLEIYEDGMRGR